MGGLSLLFWETRGPEKSQKPAPGSLVVTHAATALHTLPRWGQHVPFHGPPPRTPRRGRGEGRYGGSGRRAKGTPVCLDGASRQPCPPAAAWGPQRAEAFGCVFLLAVHHQITHRNQATLTPSCLWACCLPALYAHRHTPPQQCSLTYGHAHAYSRTRTATRTRPRTLTYSHAHTYTHARSRTRTPTCAHVHCCLHTCTPVHVCVCTPPPPGNTHTLVPQCAEKASITGRLPSWDRFVRVHHSLQDPSPDPSPFAWAHTEESHGSLRLGWQACKGCRFAWDGAPLEQRLEAPPGAELPGAVLVH